MADIKQSLIAVNARYIQLPPWFDGQPDTAWHLGLPDISVADTSQKYPLGTKYVDGERIFKYGYAAETLNPDVVSQFGRFQAISYAHIAAVASQYATELVVDVAAGDQGGGVIAKDNLAGGYICVFDADSKSFVRQIKANTVLAAAGEITLKLTDPIPVAITAVDTDHCEVMGNPWGYMVDGTTSGGSRYQMMGIAQLVYTVGQYGWFQTWGPCWLACQGEVGVCSGIENNKIVVLRHDGAGDELDMTATTHDIYNKHGQIAGYVMSCASNGSQGAPFIFLMISQ